jgi:uncharacterized protein DUF3574
MSSANIMNKKSKLLFVGIVVLSFAFQHALADKPQASISQDADSARPESAHWLRCELYFGLGTLDAQDDGVGEMRWRSFLDHEVTPRFPDGLTVIDAYGQWRGHPNEEPRRLRSKVLVILCEDTPANHASIDAIRIAYKSATHARSVLLATEHVDVSF